MPKSSKLKVFLCYDSQDRPFVHQHYRRLRGENWIEPWMADVEKVAGQAWEYETERVISTCDAAIVVLSAAFLCEEGYTKKQPRLILDMEFFSPEGTTKDFPIKVENFDTPFELKNHQYVDYFPQHVHEAAYKSLKNSLSLRKSQLGT